MTDKNEENDEIVESQISKRDKREMEKGACVNCAVASFIITILMMVALVL
ncbi:MAG: hypothetical protein ACTSU3_06160 [Candidatus Thorarchaeota archaeon]